MAILDLLQHSSSSSVPGGKFPGLVLFTHDVAKAVELGAAAGLALGLVLGTADFAVKKRSPLVKILVLCELGVSLGCLVGAAQLVGKAHTDATMTAGGVRARAAAYQAAAEVRLNFGGAGGKSFGRDSLFVAGGLVGSVLCGLVLPERWMKMAYLDRLTRGFCLGGAIASLPYALQVLDDLLREHAS